MPAPRIGIIAKVGSWPPWREPIILEALLPLHRHPNILKRLLIHVAGFNLGLAMRSLFGVGTARGLQGRCGRVLAFILAIWAALQRAVFPSRPRLASCGRGYCFEWSSPSPPPMPPNGRFTADC